MSSADKGGTTVVLYCSVVFRFKDTWKLTVHSLVGEHLSCFQVLTIATKATGNMCVQVFCVNTGFCFSWVDVWEWDAGLCVSVGFTLSEITTSFSISLGSAP